MGKIFNEVFCTCISLQCTFQLRYRAKIMKCDENASLPLIQFFLILGRQTDRPKPMEDYSIPNSIQFPEF